MLAKADNNSMNSDADMKGKKIATVIGSTGHNLIKKLLSKNGLTFDDIELINIAAGDAGIVLSTGQVDAVVVGHCHASVTELKDVQHIVVVKAFLGGQPAELGQCVRCFLTEGGKREH